LSAKASLYDCNDAKMDAAESSSAVPSASIESSSMLVHSASSTYKYVNE
ncbi:hypothetical protein Tco_0560402, partial [Tanacetum coccineum]